MTQPSKHILLCSPGASWAVIPEIWGWLSPTSLDLYAAHPQRAKLDGLRQRHRLSSPDELWVCTTGGSQTLNGVQLLREWWSRLVDPGVLRIWVAEGTDQLASQDECAAMRELIFRLALLGVDTVGERGSLVVSLAGGRKTMSADMQDAAATFGARAWLHVTGPDPLPDELKKAQVETFLAPLRLELASAITPLLAGRGTRSELLDVPFEHGTVCSDRFPIPMAHADRDCQWQAPLDTGLCDELEHRRRQGGHLLGNFVADVARDEGHENWRSLYRLAPRDIDYLRNTPLGPEHRDWLIQLPKADLHRHLGGTLDLDAQHDVAEAVWRSATAPERKLALEGVQPLIEATGDWDWGWPELLKQEREPNVLRALCCAALHLRVDRFQLERQLYGVTEPRVDLKEKHPRGFAAYERPGELSGSALLGHSAAIEPYAAAVVQQARDEGLAYLELRGSPHKYRPGDPAGFLRDLESALRKCGARTRRGEASSKNLRIGFIWILDRRQREVMAGVVAQAVATRSELEGFLLGLDLAGDEGTAQPEEIAAVFRPAFEACMPITIHAGEGESAENIWQAAYHLHADRIGHGLSIIEHTELAQRFRDRRIALEICPTSNREVIGYADPDVPASKDGKAFPLRGMLDQRLPLSLCTDNPGISRTTLPDEFLAASRMGGDLSLWEVLGLIRNGFVNAMLRADERDRLVRELESRIAADAVPRDRYLL